tara:strand:- start:2027 stop:2284 length:258 start_codon:yes stop_codon:yes gene_type:complete
MIFRDGHISTVKEGKSALYSTERRFDVVLSDCDTRVIAGDRFPHQQAYTIALSYLEDRLARIGADTPARLRLAYLRLSDEAKSSG